MARKRKSQRRDDSSSSDASSSDASSSDSSSSDSRDLANNSCDEKPSAATTTRSRRTSESHSAIEKRRNTKKIEDKGIEQMLKELKEDTSAMRNQLKILNKTNNETRKIRKELKKLRKHLVGSSGYDSATAPRSESNEAQPPKYRLEFTCKVKPELSKGENIKTEEHGEDITVALFDEHNKIVETGPLASATVGLVVVDGNIQYNWRRKDFERSIRRPPKMNSAMGDLNQPVESIVSGGVITLESGVQRHTGAKILYNSSNKKVRLGVRLLLPTTEGRVLEGLSNRFVVRGHDRPTRQSKKQKGPAMQSISSLPIQTQPGETRFHTAVGPSTDPLSTDQNTYSPSQYLRQDDPSLLMTASVPQDLTSGVAQPASWTDLWKDIHSFGFESVGNEWMSVGNERTTYSASEGEGSRNYTDGSRNCTDE